MPRFKLTFVAICPLVSLLFSLNNASTAAILFRVTTRYAYPRRGVYFTEFVFFPVKNLIRKMLFFLGAYLESGSYIYIATMTTLVLLEVSASHWTFPTLPPTIFSTTRTMKFYFEIFWNISRKRILGNKSHLKNKNMVLL